MKLTLNIAKSTVKGHYRRSKTGKPVFVREHSDSRTKKAMPRVQDISKILIKSGLKKKSSVRENFQTKIVGDYDIRHLKAYGLNHILITPMNGVEISSIQKILQDNGVDSYERKGLIVIGKRVAD